MYSATAISGPAISEKMTKVIAIYQFLQELLRTSTVAHRSQPQPAPGPQSLYSRADLQAQVLSGPEVTCIHCCPTGNHHCTNFYRHSSQTECRYILSKIMHYGYRSWHFPSWKCSYDKKLLQITALVTKLRITYVTFMMCQRFEKWLLWPIEPNFWKVT